MRLRRSATSRREIPAKLLPTARLCAPTTAKAKRMVEACAGLMEEALSEIKAAQAGRDYRCPSGLTHIPIATLRLPISFVNDSLTTIADRARMQDRGML